MIEGVKIYDQEAHRDSRGFLLNLAERKRVGEKPFGHSYVVASNPGVVRGNHYHKWSTEWFCVIKGKGRLALKKGGQKVYLDLDDVAFKVVEIPPGVTHAIKNIADETMLMFAYTDKVFDPNNTDTYPESIDFN